MEQAEGGCRCGRVRFRVSGPPLITMACHCTGCQRMTASAFSLSSLYSADRFEITAGEPVVGGMHATPRHEFCPWCMSWMFTRWQGDLVNVRSTMLDDLTGQRPFIESYASEKLPWVETGAVHAFAEFPSMEQYPELIAEFAGWRAF